MAGLEFPTQKKPEAPSEESMFGGLPTPAWAMAKPKAAAAAAATDKPAAAEKAAKPAAAKKGKEEKKLLRVDLSGFRTLEALLALVAIAAFAALGTLLVWAWPEFSSMFRRYF